MLKYRIIYAAALILSAATFVYTNTAMSLIFLTMVVLIPIFIKISAFDNAGKIRIECNMAEYCVVGKDNAVLEMTVRNKSRLPMGNIEVVIAYENRMFGETYEEKIQLCGTGKEQVYKIPVMNEKCGRSCAEIKEVYCCDMLNITRSKFNFAWKKEYTVYPELPDVQVYTQKILNAEFGGYNYDKARKGNDNSEVFALREYVDGDSLNAAHWKLSAKADEIIIREWSRPNNFRIMLAVDLAKKDINKNNVTAETLSAIMGISASVSREIIKHGIGHNAAMIYNGMQLDVALHRTDDATVMFDEMMSIVIPENSGDFVGEFLAMNFHNRYSKLIYVGPRANARQLAAIAAYTDVTAIAIKADADTTYDRDEGYPIYTMSPQGIKSKAPFIEL